MEGRVPLAIWRLEIRAFSGLSELLAALAEPVWRLRGVFSYYLPDFSDNPATGSGDHWLRSLAC